MTIKDNDDIYFDLDINKLSLKKRKSDGYIYFYMPQHPLAAQNGSVSIQRHIMSAHLRRWLKPDEAVKFINNDRSDYRLENLKLVPYDEIFKEVTKPGRQVKLTCEICGTPFSVSLYQSKRRKHCSLKCGAKAQRRFDITPEELADLVWEMPTTHIAEMYGVSDKAIAKRCKKHNIQKPPRGYWAKLQAGQIDPLVAKEIKGDKRPSSLQPD